MSVGSVRDLLSLKQCRALVAFVVCIVWCPAMGPDRKACVWRVPVGTSLYSQAEPARSEFRHGNLTRAGSKIRGCRTAHGFPVYSRGVLGRGGMSFPSPESAIWMILRVDPARTIYLFVAGSMIRGGH